MNISKYNCFFNFIVFMICVFSCFNLKAVEGEKRIKLKLKNFDYESVKTICGESDQAMVYGWSACLYRGVYRLLMREGSPIRKAYNYRIGGTVKLPKWKNRPAEYQSDFDRKFYNEIRKGRNTWMNQLLTTLEGWKIEQIPVVLKTEDESRECKMGLTNIVFENYKRMIKGVPFIKVLFVVDIDDNPYVSDAQTITSREELYNSYVTNKELRRAYKLCMELEGDLKCLEEVARQSIIFVKVTKTSKNKYGLVTVNPFWEAEEWNYFWAERLATKKEKNDDQKLLWREELEKALHNFENNT